MAGEDQTPVKGDVRRIVEGGYRPVGATNLQVLTQGPDWDGINRGIGMFLDIGSNYARSRSSGSGKQDYSGQYQVEMNDIAANPLYHDASGMYNSKGREAIRALNQKYAPYVSGAEIRATEGHVAGGYKDSVDSAIREVNVKQRASDYEAQNKRYTEMWDAAHPESINLPFETRSALGKNMSDRSNAIKSIATGLMNGDLSSISDPAIRQMAEYTIKNMSSEDIEHLRTMGDTVEDQAKLADFLTSLGVQLGNSQAEARVMAIDASKGLYGYINKYRNDLQQLTDDELKYKKSLAANETFDQLPTSDQGVLSLTNQLSAETMARGLVGGFRVSDAFKTEKVGDKYRRVLITGDKKVIDFGLNHGNELTSSATLAGITGKIVKAQEEGNSTPLMGLRNIPNLGGVMLAENGSEEFALAKQQLADAYSLEIARNARHYYKSNNEVNDDMKKQISSVINTASYLGYTNDECQAIVNKALETIGMKPIKGVHTPEELDRTVGASLTRLGDMIFGKKKEEPEEESNDFGVDVNDYLGEGNQVSMPTSEESGEPVNDEEAQMTKVDVYNNPEFIDFRNKIMQAAKNRQIEPDQAANEINLKEQEIKQRQEQSSNQKENAMVNMLKHMFGVKEANAETRKAREYLTGEIDSNGSFVIDKNVIPQYIKSGTTKEDINKPIDDLKKVDLNGRKNSRVRDLVALMLQREAGNLGFMGKYLAASAIMNRTKEKGSKDKTNPEYLISVIKSRGQFEPLSDQRVAKFLDINNTQPVKDLRPGAGDLDKDCLALADAMVRGVFKPLGNITSFQNPNTAKDKKTLEELKKKDPAFWSVSVDGPGNFYHLYYEDKSTKDYSKTFRKGAPKKV